MIDVERVDYVRVPATDIEKAKRFYGEVLGLRENPARPATFLNRSRAAEQICLAPRPPPGAAAARRT